MMCRAQLPNTQDRSDGSASPHRATPVDLNDYSDQELVAVERLILFGRSLSNKRSRRRVG
jgi:hypothetical protein